MILVLFGPPGCGKGTQAELLEERRGWFHLSTGDLLRDLKDIQNPDEETKKALDLMAQGKMVSNKFAFDLVIKVLDKVLDDGKSVILDGVIRNQEQTELYWKYFEEKSMTNQVKAVWIALSDGEAWNRITKRRICKKCDDIIPFTASTAELKEHPQCGGKLITREDDNPEVARRRFEEMGRDALKPVLDFYRGKGVLDEIDGNGEIEEVYQELEYALDQ